MQWIPSKLRRGHEGEYALRFPGFEFFPFIRFGIHGLASYVKEPSLVFIRLSSYAQFMGEQG